MKRWLLQIVVVLACALCNFAQTGPAADMIIQNAHVWTVDPSRPEAEAVAIVGERIVAVGSSHEADAWRGPKTRVVDAAGKRLLPGFNDAHVHFMDGGSQLDNVELNDATSPQEFARRIRERAGKTAKGRWLLGGDWDETKWNPAELPTKELIDAATPETPVAVNRYDGHMILARVGGHHRANARSRGRSDCARSAGKSDGRAERRGDGSLVQSGASSQP